MADRIVYVYVNLKHDQYLVGRLWVHSKRGRDSTSFEYETSWLSHHDSFPLEPLLSLTAGAFHTDAGKALFGAIGDSAPDRWGRVLMRRAARAQANAENKPAHTLTEMDYLLAVNDEARQGALRFTMEKDGPFLAEAKDFPIPPLIDLPKLLSATEHFLNDEESDEDLRLLLAPGSSLGGARPKASVRDYDGQLMFAKFPHKDDEFKTVLWEAMALNLASNAGIMVPHWRIENIAGKQVLLLRRFDREQEVRIPFLSAMSMLGAKDNEDHSYLEIVDAIRQYGATPKEDMIALWRRIVFSILISNTDDHLRNHAFLYNGQRGWRLSPAYDLNPTPIEIRPRILRTAIDLDDNTASLELALSVIEDFGLNKNDAKEIISEVGYAVSQWRDVANGLGLKKREMDRMSSAFEHHDFKVALKM